MSILHVFPHQSLGASKDVPENDWITARLCLRLEVTNGEPNGSFSEGFGKRVCHVYTYDCIHDRYTSLKSQAYQ